MVADAAGRLGIECLVLNPRYSARTDLELLVSAGVGRLRYHSPNGVVDLSNATGAYVRLLDYSQLPEFLRGSPLERMRMEAWHAILNDWLEIADLEVMNRLRPSNSNMSKPYQAQLIARCGIETPKTLVTNQPEEVRAFISRHGRVVFKSISAHRSIVKELTPDLEERLDRLYCLPTQFQELIEGDDVRVHVVGEKLFATLIRSDVVDYRYAANDNGKAEYCAIKLPGNIEQKCFALSRHLGLPLCGIDFKHTDAGRYVCLEVNPSPAFSCFEEQTQQPVAEAIACYLDGGHTSA
jgi:glutathione synthase/RimK-type ligase-like ATP-grasp enzyme